MDYFARACRKLSTFSSKKEEASDKSTLLEEEEEEEQPRPVAPKGCLAVYVGVRREDETTKFVIPTSYLGLPAFRDLMESAAEEFGYDHEGGGIRIPCDDETFRRTLKDLEDTLRISDRRKPACVKKFRRGCRTL